jgi:hypothetical protein
VRGHARRRDANEPAIVEALQAAGAVVERLGYPKGVPDLLVGYQGRTFLLEVKNPDRKRKGGGTSGAKPGERRTPGRGVLTKDQVTWFGSWKGAPVVEVINADEALAAIATKPDLKLARKVGDMFTEATR